MQSYDKSVKVNNNAATTKTYKFKKLLVDIWTYMCREINANIGQYEQIQNCVGSLKRNNIIY